MALVSTILNSILVLFASVLRVLAFGSDKFVTHAATL
jgi:hypothetical protein